MTNGWSAVPQSSNCMDPAAKRSPPLLVSADSLVQYYQYSKAYFTIPAWTDKVVIQAWTDRTAPLAPVIQAVGIAAHGGNGVPFPGSCHNLILDMSKGAVLLSNFTDANGLAPINYLVAGPRKAINGLGLTVWSQAAWLHSQTGALTLSRATSTGNWSPLQMNDTIPKRKYVSSSSPSATSGNPPEAECTIIRYN